MNCKPGLGLGGSDQIDDDTVADQRRGLPVHRDEREQPMLDLVPFARPRRQVVHDNVDAKFEGKTMDWRRTVAADVPRRPMAVG